MKPTKPQAGFDQDMTTFDELADMPTQGSDTREAPEAEPPQEERLPTIYEESKADLEAHIMEVRHTRLQDKGELLEATPVEELLHCTHTADL
eukprot:5216825-Pyramimonas_sp.AAC.1